MMAHSWEEDFVHSKFLKNVSYSLLANLVSFSISVILVLVAPKFLGPKEYGMWQLFLFYISFAGCCHFGWIDGIYLRYAGYFFERLSARVFSGQYLGIICLEIIIGALIYFCAVLFVKDPVHSYILRLSSVFPLLYNFNLLCNFALQIANRIKNYAILVLVEKTIFFIGFLLLIVFGFHYFIGFYFIKILSLLAACAAGALMCKRLFTFSLPSFQMFFNEARENIWVGIKLLIANTSSVLVIGIIRYGISVGWDVITFGKVSLTLSISNFLMIFINSVSIVLFPMLKTISQKRLAPLYFQIRDVISFLLFSMLIFYYPMRLILGIWLPQYEDYLKYMVILFPVCVFESKVGLLVNTYLKDLRQEALMLKINIYAVLLSAVWTIISTVIVHNLDLAVLGIVVACAFRCIVSEHYIQKLLQIKLMKKICIDIILVLTFMISGYLFEGFICTAIYTLTYAAILFWHRKSIFMNIMRLKNGG